MVGGPASQSLPERKVSVDEFAQKWPMGNRKLVQRSGVGGPVDGMQDSFRPVVAFDKIGG